MPRVSSYTLPLSLLVLAPALAAQDSLKSAPTAREAKPAPTVRELFGAGWRWELAPTPLRAAFDPRGETKPKAWMQHGQTAFVPSGHVFLVHTSGGHPVLLHVRTKAVDVRGSAAPDFRPVLLTSTGERIWTMMSMGATRSGLGENRYIFAPLKDPESVTSFALGVLDLEGKRERAREAEVRTKNLGASVLPLPVIDQPLEFELPTLQGERFRSKDHLGKVIVIDSWATW